MRARLFFLLLAFSAAAAAQYPSRPIHLIVPIPPGGAPDIAARVLGQKLSEQTGQPVVVENRVGSNGNIATELVARAAPDGYTLGLVADSQIAINPHLYSKMSFDTLRDLTPVSSVASNQFVLAINASLPVNSFPEFIEYARKANPPLSYASGGNGSQHHLTMEMLKVRTGVDLVHVPYRGGAPARWRRCGRAAPTRRRSRPADCVRWRCRAASARRNIPSCRRSASSTRDSRTASGSACSRRRDCQSRCWSACAPKSCARSSRRM